MKEYMMQVIATTIKISMFSILIGTIAIAATNNYKFSAILIVIVHIVCWIREDLKK